MEGISLRINELIDKLFDGNNSKFAEKLGINEANVRNYRKGTLPKIDFIVKIYENIEFNFDWLLTGKGDILGNEYKINVDFNNLVSEPVNNCINQIDFKEKLIEVLQNQNKDLQNDKIELQKDKIELQKDKELLAQILNLKMGKEKSA